MFVKIDALALVNADYDEFVCATNPVRSVYIIDVLYECMWSFVKNKFFLLLDSVFFGRAVHCRTRDGVGKEEEARRQRHGR